MTVDIFIVLVICVSRTVAQGDAGDMDTYTPDPRFESITDAGLENHAKSFVAPMHIVSHPTYVTGFPPKVDLDSEIWITGTGHAKRIGPALSKVKNSGDIAVLTILKFVQVFGNLSVNGTTNDGKPINENFQFTSSTPDVVGIFLLRKNESLKNLATFHFAGLPRYKSVETPDKRVPSLLQALLNAEVRLSYKSIFESLANYLSNKVARAA